MNNSAKTDPLDYRLAARRLSLVLVVICGFLIYDIVKPPKVQSPTEADRCVIAAYKAGARGDALDSAIKVCDKGAQANHRIEQMVKDVNKSDAVYAAGFEAGIQFAKKLNQKDNK